MERTKKRPQNLLARMVATDLSAKEITVRAYSHHGHGPRADQKGRIHICDFRSHAETQLHSAAGPYILASRGRMTGARIATAPEAIADILKSLVRSTPESGRVSGLAVMAASDPGCVKTRLC